MYFSVSSRRTSEKIRSKIFEGGGTFIFSDFHIIVRAAEFVVVALEFLELLVIILFRTQGTTALKSDGTYRITRFLKLFQLMDYLSLLRVGTNTVNNS